MDKVITKDGKKWNWCPHHKKFVLLHGRFGKHTPDTCSLNPKNKKSKVKEEKRKDLRIDVNLAEESDDSNESSTDSDEKSTKSNDSSDSNSE